MTYRPADPPPHLAAERQPIAERAVQRRAGEAVLVGAVEIGGLAPDRPAVPFARGEGAHRADPALRRVGRVGAQEGDRIEAVILARPFHPVTRDGPTHRRGPPGAPL